MSDRITEARRVAREAFDALWMPGAKQRTPSRERALYWLSIALRKPGKLPDFDKLDLDGCIEVSRLCRRAHGPTTVSLRS